MLQLDGSLGEGGGQILRTSLALSLITAKPFQLRNIRAGRQKPGLHPQHLMSVTAAATIGQAHVVGASLHSRDLVFEPGSVAAGDYQFHIGTAGATGHVLQTIYLPLACRGTQPSSLTLTGGTHVTTSPCYHFLETTWRAYLQHIGIRVELGMRRPGFYPRGGGIVEALISPCTAIHGLALTERAAVHELTGFSAVASLPESIAERQARQATDRLAAGGIRCSIRREAWDGGPGTVLTLVAPTAPAPTLFFGLGARGKRAERVADEAAKQALAYLAAAPAAVDPHSADQIVLPLALAKGPSTFTVTEITRHLTTNISVIRRFLDRDIVCEGAEGSPGLVHIQ